jgi:hypothetical protein
LLILKNLLLNFDSFGQAVSEEKIFLEINQSETSHRCFLPSFGSFGQAVSEENIF